jgi:hypothetical protein
MNLRLKKEEGISFASGVEMMTLYSLENMLVRAVTQLAPTVVIVCG